FGTWVSFTNHFTYNFKFWANEEQNELNTGFGLNFGVVTTNAQNQVQKFEKHNDTEYGDGIVAVRNEGLAPAYRVKISKDELGAPHKYVDFCYVVGAHVFPELYEHFSLDVTTLDNDLNVCSDTISLRETFIYAAHRVTSDVPKYLGTYTITFNDNLFFNFDNNEFIPVNVNGSAELKDVQFGTRTQHNVIYTVKYEIDDATNKPRWNIYDDNGDKVASRIDRLTNTINSLHLKFKIEGEAQVGDTWTYETSGEDTDTIHIEVDENFGEMSVTNGLSGKKLTMLAEDGKTVVISVTNPGTFKEAGDFEQTHGNGNAVLDTPTLGENILRGTYTIQYNENPVGVFDSNDNNQGDAIVKNFTYEDPTHISDSYTLTYKGPAVDEFVPGDNLGNATLSNATFGNSILQAEYSLEYVGATAGAFLAGNNNGSAVLIHATYGDEILQGEYTITYDGTKWLLTDPNNIVYEMQQGTEENVFISDALGFTVCTGQAREGDTYTCYVTKWRCQDEFGRTITLTETAPNTFTSTSIGFTVNNVDELVVTDKFTANVTKWEMKDADNNDMILKESARGKFTAQIEDAGNIIDVFEYEIVKGQAEVNDTYTCYMSNWSMIDPLGEYVALVEENGVFTSESLGFTIASGTAEYGDTFTCEVELKENPNASDFRVLKVGAQFDSSSIWDIKMKNLVLQGGKVLADDQGGSGGVLYLRGAEVDLELDNVTVSNGYATKSGGG
ncbi:MAG TPA: hypothetical protein PLR86_09765, partial [Planctomycetota bacterium]|nr:hypothetical protein [Planctomycetota bacterium]